MLSFHVTFDATAIPRWVERMNNNVDEAVAVSSQVIAAFAKGVVAIDTGSLRDTIDSEKDSNSTDTHHVYQVSAGNLDGGYKGGSKYNTGKPQGSPVDYAPEQEWGGGVGAHQPFMTPASEQGFMQAPQIVGAAIANTP